MKRSTVCLIWLACVGLSLAALRSYWLSTSNMPSAPSEISSDRDSKSSVVAQRSSELGSHPLDPVLELARLHAEVFDRDVKDYETRLTKEERVAGKLGAPHTMVLKLRCPGTLADGSQQKTHVYLRFEEPKGVRGREVIWVDGKNNGQLIAHEAGWLNLTRVQLDPDGTLAMMGNKYPITQIGLGKLLHKLIEKGERDRVEPDCQVTMRQETFLDCQCTLIEVVHPRAKPTLDFHIARIYLDETRHVPLRYESYLWPKEIGGEPLLEERYTYEDIRLNVGLTDDDFDPNNPAYSFP